MSAVNELIKGRGIVKGSITRLKTYAENVADDTSIESVIARRERLEECWKEFQELDAKLVLAEQASELTDIEEKYFEIKEIFLKHISFCVKSEKLETLLLPSPRKSSEEELNTTLNQVLQQQNSILLQQHQQDGIRLPSLSITPFAGDLKEWPAFKDSFTSSIHSNIKLPVIHKFQYLKGLVQGEAASVIKHFVINADNYEEAWAKLCQRYDKKKAILSAYIKSFVDQPVLSTSSVSQLRQLADQSDEIIRGINSLGNEATKRDPWLIYMLFNKVDAETKRLWAIETASINYPTVSQFLEFLATRCDALETVQPSSSNDRRVDQKRSRIHSLFTTASFACQKCHQSHAIYKCPAYKGLSVDKRREFVGQNQLCFNCLTPGHQAASCTSKFSCHYCKNRHHSTLHIQSASTTQQASQGARVKQNQIAYNPQKVSDKSYKQALPQVVSHNAKTKELPTRSSDMFINSSNPQRSICQELQSLPTHFRQTFALLPTAQVYAVDASGHLQLCRVLLDSASGWSFISESCANRLKLKRTSSHANVSGIGATPAATSKQTTTVRLLSRFDYNCFIDLFDAHVLPKVTSKLPSSEFNIDDWEYIKGLPLADPCVNVPQNIDILVGAEHFFKILKKEKIHGQFNHPIAQSTIFGWILAGKIPQSTQSATLIHSMTTSLNNMHECEASIDQLIKRFWEIEEVISSKPHYSAEEKAVEDLYTKHHSISEDNRHIVQLPFKHQISELGESIHAALSRLHSIERRLEKCPQLDKEYKDFMSEYVSLGHMERIPDHQIAVPSHKHYYLPHHPVIRESSSTTKVRVVFDGSCNTTSGQSLNSQLMNGPIIQRDLQAILMKFRKHPIAFCADIEKMYRQVLLKSTHWDFQRILWRQNIEEPISHFRLKTVTYGTTSAPFLAIRSLVETANEFENQFPTACKVIKSDFYVDDLISGAETIQKAKELQQQITSILSSRGFNLRKWVSNSQQVAHSAVQNGNAIPINFNDTTSTIKVLGLQWCSSGDFFTFKVTDIAPTSCSKRIILSESSKIFDPLGFLAPCTVAVKIMFQQLWLQNLDWDDQVPPEIAHEWLKIRNQYQRFRDLEIPRLVFPVANSIQFHGFSDASQRAYSAVVYARSTSPDGKSFVRLMAAKTKVAPLKQVTIPRLELCGAALLTKLMQSVITALEMPSAEQVAWTDSTTVLSWLASYPCRWKTYVAKRVSEIVESLPRKSWRYVRSQHNPADCASRGVTPEELSNQSLWWHGPSWLSEHEEKWPTTKSTAEQQEIMAEERTSKASVYNTSISIQEIDVLFERHSSLSKILRILAYVRRMLGSKLNPRISTWLSSDEINQALSICVQWSQRTHFQNELNALTQKQRINSKSKLAALTPFLDQGGVLRVGGRLEHANIPYDAKHPVILSHQHILSKRIVEQYHQKHLHAGATFMSNILRQRFWIIGCRSLTKFIAKNCVTCFRHRASRESQLMAHLPEPRVKPGRAFLYTGIDYAGPIKIREHRLRKARIIKTYVAVFVCLATKAVHLELVDDLTSEAFIAALTRFVSRRGIPAQLYSDNGTNFVGAKHILTELNINSLYENQLIANFCLQQSITWRMIPPSSPHFGGLWEAAVKSMKFHLKRVIGETTLTFSEMATLLTQIEGILNSRPLIKRSEDDSDNVDVLTPGHFLIGQPIIAIPEQTLNKNVPIRTRWRLIMKLHQDFWKQWHQEYLHTLQSRSKWRAVKSNLRVDDIVLLREENQPPTCWPLGRVVEVHPGKDGLVRVVTVKTASGFYKRPMIKLSKLPISESPAN